MSMPCKALFYGYFALLAALANPAIAQTIYYEDGTYLYAVPEGNAATKAEEQTSTVRDDESAGYTIVRTIPAPVHSASAMQIILPDNEPAPALPVVLPTTRVGDAAGIYPSSDTPAAPVSDTSLPNGARLVEFDPDAWLSECSDRLSGYDENDRGKVIGALLGAAAGSFAGNRLADGDRFAGTALGASAGALAGATIGDSIDDRADGRALERGRANAGSYCAAYLEDYLTRASNHGGYGTSYVPGQQYMLVPVSVPVARQVEYRDVVPAGN